RSGSQVLLDLPDLPVNSDCGLKRAAGISQEPLSQKELCPGRAEPASSDLSNLVHFLPVDARRRQHDSLSNTVAAADGYVEIRHVQHLYHHLVLGSAVVRVDDAHAVGQDQTALEWHAASGEDGEEIPRRDADDETRPDEGN